MYTDQHKFYGYSNKTYNFNIYPIGTSFKPLSGVYIFLKRTVGYAFKTDYKVIYIGQTENFDNRLDKNHHRYECIMRNNATHIGILTIKGINERLNIESDLISNYPTPCNQQ